MKSIKYLYDKYNSDENIYPHKTLTDIRAYINANKINIFEYICKYDLNIQEYLDVLIDEMLETVKNGLSKENLVNDNKQRLAKEILFKASQITDKYESEKTSLLAYIYASSEEYSTDTKKEVIMISSLIYYYYYQKDFTKQSLIEALSVAGLFANIIKESNYNKDLAMVIGVVFIAYLNDATIILLEYTVFNTLEKTKDSGNDLSLNLLQIFDIERLSRTIFDLIDDNINLDQYLNENNLFL